MFHSAGTRSFRKRIAAGGVNTQIQFNNSGALAGDANLTWNTATAYLNIGNSSVNVAANSTTLAMGNIGGGIGSIAVSTATIIVGNSTINCSMNSSSLYFVGGTTTPAIVIRGDPVLPYIFGALM